MPKRPEIEWLPNPSVTLGFGGGQQHNHEALRAIFVLCS